VAVVQGLLLLVHLHLVTTVEMVVQVGVEAEVLLEVALQVQAVTALSFYTTKEF
jgi:hypothetical protein